MSMTLHSQSVNVDRLELLKILKANRIKHVKQFDQAVIDYRIAIQDDLNTALLQAKDPNFDILKLKVRFDAPVSYESNYTTWIDMLTASKDKLINLDTGSFNACYKDQWQWSSTFELSNSTYSSKALSVSGRTGNVALAGSVSSSVRPNSEWPFPAGSTAQAAKVAAAPKRRRGSK